VRDPKAGLSDLVDRARQREPIRLAVVAAEQSVVLETVTAATDAGLVQAHLIGSPDAISECARSHGVAVDEGSIIAAESASAAARTAIELVRRGEADAIMKGQIHTDALMHALLDKKLGLRVPGYRVSHAFVVELTSYHKLLTITDAAINISPDLDAKADILRNAVALVRALGCDHPKAAVLSAVETVNPAISSTLDAAALALMAQRGQIAGAQVDGPLAFDNAISAEAAHEKGIQSDIAGDADILLVPDLVSGNCLAKTLAYLANATAAGVVLGLSAPVVLTSRADPMAARMASLAIAILMRNAIGPAQTFHRDELQSAIHCAAQPEAACGPVGV